MNLNPFDWLRKNSYVVIFSVLTLLTFIVLYYSRSLDDNRLTNWQWAFDVVDPLRVFFILVIGLLFAYIISKTSFIDRYPIAWLFLSSYIITSLIWREPEVIIDSSRYFTQAKHLEVYGIGYFFREWGRDIVAWTDMPLIPFIYGIIFKFFGEGRIPIQIFTTFLFSMTVVLTYLIGKTLWDENIGLFGGMLLIGIPYLFIQTPLMLIDIPTMFFLTLSILTFIKALENGKAWIVFSSISIFFTFYSKYSTWPMMSVLVVIFIVCLFQRKDTVTNPPIPPLLKGGEGGITKKHASCIMHHESCIVNHASFYRGLITTLISCLLIGIVFWYKSDVFLEQITLLITYQKPGLKRWSESYISTFLFQIHPFITASALYSVYVAFRKKDIKYLITAWLVLLVFLFQIKRIRYVIVVFPMLSLMASYGFMQIGDREKIKFISLCIVIFSVIVAIFVYLPFMEKMSVINLKNAGEFLDSLEKSNVKVFTTPLSDPVVNPAVSVPLLDIFTKKKIYYDNDTNSSVNYKDIEESSLRFTWEYKNPDYYRGGSSLEREDTAIVIISDDNNKGLPEDIQIALKGYRLVKIFDVCEGIFRYRTSVSIYQ
jgi:hypothetical protein